MAYEIRNDIVDNIHVLRPKCGIVSETRYVSVVKWKLRIRPAGFFSNRQSLSLVQFQLSVLTYVYTPLVYSETL